MSRKARGVQGRCSYFCTRGGPVCRKPLRACVGDERDGSGARAARAARGTPLSRPRVTEKLSAPPTLRCAQIRHNLQSFLLGGVTALSVGYYRVHQDIWTAAEAVDTRLNEIGTATVSTQNSVLKRIGALEGEVAMLKGALAAEQAKKE